MAYIGRNPRLKSIVSEGDTLANLTAEPRVAGRLVWATDELKFYYDDGTTLNVVGSGEGGGGGVPLLSKGGLITSDGTNNGELAVGSDGQVLAADSNEDSGLLWKTINEVPIVGTTGFVLTKTASGYEWQAAAGGGMKFNASVNTLTSSYTVPAGTYFVGQIWASQGAAKYKLGNAGNNFLSLGNNGISQTYYLGSGTAMVFTEPTLGFPASVRITGHLMSN
jgi:hypothetical protein